ncbi:hydroxymethylbilane synthase [Hankyongella ginsenosidimutans]|uniref:hydroxymethylbilane synthase n=1 Tax=Hankyongella ginsenosidimutans TaxID=1763828 RepID=UPI001FE74CFE|nr:hydroxymethylbilane synthase [Hankyongella ginsenosidimutans]
MTPRLKLGTRGSPLALAQAHAVRRLLAASAGLPEDAIEVVAIKTSGDRIQDRPLSEVGGKGLFTKELEEALLDRRIDLAVHSMKDVATHLPPGLRIAATLPREDVRDCLLTRDGGGLDALPANARLGTSSLRRAAQMRALRPDLIVTPLRGNVETRMAKLADGVADATLLAMAGLNRLGIAHTGTALPVEMLLPAPAQGPSASKSASTIQRPPRWSRRSTMGRLRSPSPLNGRSWPDSTARAGRRSRRWPKSPATR